jgi:hypothetical protein
LASVLTGVWASGAMATEPCGDFGECKVLVEINATDGDVGFHFLMDGDDLQWAQMRDPNRRKVFQAAAGGPLREQRLTEVFAESAEPLCWPDPEADEDEEIVTLEAFLTRWTPGIYTLRGFGQGQPRARGQTELTFDLPAAPQAVDFDGSVISWTPGNDLGRCASYADLNDLVQGGVLPTHPENVAVAAWEIVLEPDVDDGDPVGELVYSIRLPGDIALHMVTVPADYLAALPEDTPAKIEVGAIGVDDNATFSEQGDFCVNEVEGCDEDDEDE